MEYKGYNIVNDPEFMSKRIEPIGRGSVHLSLRGRFTSEGIAKKVIDAYELTKPTEVESVEEEPAIGKKRISRRSKQV